MAEVLFYILCFFPFISLQGSDSSDVQPYCLIYTIIMFIVICMKEKICMDKKMYALYRVIILGILVGCAATIIWDGFDFSGILRYLATYCGLILISYVSYNICLKNEGLNEKLTKIIINIWLLVGMIQTFISREFCSNFIANARTTANRGVIGLASEPSFYGYMCIFFALLVLEFQTQQIFYWLNLLFQIVFLAKSATTVLYLIILLGIIGLFFVLKGGLKRTVIFFIVTASLIIGCMYFVEHADSGQRIVYFLKILVSGRGISGLIGQFGSDGSIRIRVRDIWMCIEGFIDYLGFPHGFHTKKISSGYGSILYTMGWVGVIIIVYLYNLIRSAFENEMIQKIVPTFLTIILFSAIQLSNPIIGFILGFYMYKRKILCGKQNELNQRK